MQIFHALVLGFVEGITEFLPISSTAHLIIVSTLLKLPQNEVVTLFEVFIQLGAIMAIVALYWKLVWTHRRYFMMALAGFLPTAVIGVFFYEIVKNIFFQSTVLIAFALVVVGLLFIIVEKLHLPLHKTLRDLTYHDAIICGIAQSFALIPGVSRVGVVLITMLLMRYKRADAAVFSFLIAVPTMLGASALDFVKTDAGLLTSNVMVTLAIGAAAAFATALVSVKWLVGFLQKHDLQGFAFYRIALGFSLLFLHL